MIIKRKSVISLATAFVMTLMSVFPVNAVEETSDVIRVMPLGDSITDGYSTLGGYRQPLANMLEENGYSDNIDFVGPNWGGNCYDCQHAGYSGYSIDNIDQADSISGARTGISSFIDWLMESYPADVVMLQIGTNDILSYYDLDNIGVRLENLVDTILTYIPDDGMLYLATIPCMDATNTLYINEYYFTVESMDACVDAYNAEIKRIAAEKQAEGCNVRLSDVNSVLTKADLYDGVHPSESGYGLMADHWYDILTDYVDGEEEQPTTEPSTEPTEPITEPETEEPTDDIICVEPMGNFFIESLPDKVKYNIGEELDLSGLAVSLTYYTGLNNSAMIYDNVSPLDYPEAFVVDTSEFDSSTEGTYTITVKCTDDIAYDYWVLTDEYSFDVTVEESTEEPTDDIICIEPLGEITIDSLPNKVEYNIGEELDLSGLAVSLAYYTGLNNCDMIYDNVSPLDYPEAFVVDTSEFDSSTEGTYTITVKCTAEIAGTYWVLDSNCSFDVTVAGLTTTESTTITGNVLRGDVSYNGSVEVADLVLMNKCLIGQDELVTVQFANADMNGNDKLDIFDAVLLRRLLLSVDEI